MEGLVAILHDNSYSQHLRSMGKVEHLEDYHVALNDLDQHWSVGPKNIQRANSFGGGHCLD